MNKEELSRRQNNPKINFIKDHIVTKDDTEKNFIFVSCKSDDWEVVLGDVVYRLVREYGLNVYFDDGSFDAFSDPWIDQFRKNMDAPNCAGVLAFVDDKYTTNYAKALELMYSQCENGFRDDIPVIQVNIGKTTSQTGNIQNTGLGKSKDEKVFNKCFTQLVERGKIRESKNRYDVNEGELTAYGCSEIVKELIAKLSINLYDGEYKQEQNTVILTRECSDIFLKNLKASIEDACEVKVFDMETT